MARRRTVNVVVRSDLEEEKLSRTMFNEYREENAKDLEREGCGEW